MKTPQLPPLAGMTPLGFARPTAAAILQRRANAPLRPTVAQEPRHELGGLFGDTHNQLDLIDQLRRES